MAGKDRRLWTVLIYMVADDPQGGKLLDEQAIREMDQIIKATLSVEPANKLRVALQIDFRTFPGVWRRVIGEDTFVSPESTAADPATLYGFFDWAVNECPAEHYLLMFWGHSRGQFGMFGDSDPFDYTAQTLTLEELREALTAAKRSIQKPVDIIAFKDCFMANLETAYELNGLADYLLASPGLVPVEGWPYDEIFKALANDKTSYKAGVKALDLGDELLPKFHALFRGRIDVACAALESMEGLTCTKPDAGFFLFPRVDGDDVAIARRWLDELNVAVMPGSAFGSSGAGHLRMSLSCSNEELTTALERVAGAGIGG